jgi:cytochrome c nitrite reductase small subunit
MAFVKMVRSKRETVLGRSWLTPLAALPAAIAADVFAQETIPDFQFDPLEELAASLLIWVSLLSLGVVLFTLYRVSRRQLVGLAGKGLLVVGVVVLPSFSVATGMLLVFARAERVEFCGSCHQAMDFFIDDMTDAEGNGLAALHYRNRYIPSNQCYECHTSYGLFGTAEAKLHGVGEVGRYYSNTFETPIRMWQPYRNGDCLKCHARSAKWLAAEAHTSEGMKAELFEDRTSCMDCHDSAHDPQPSAAGAES